MNKKKYFSNNYWSNPKIAINIIKDINNLINKINKNNINIMEVCGTHTMSIASSGIRTLVPGTINLMSGPGCPVCVTSGGDIDRILNIAQKKDVIIVSFGDMLKVKGSARQDLNYLKAMGADVRIVYSPLDALTIAKENPKKEVVFVGVGFETTAPLIAFVIKTAFDENIKNFCVAPLFKIVPPALRYLLDNKNSKIDAFILPGHVSVIIGYDVYGFLEKEYNIPSIVCGFEPLDILRTINLILKQIYEKKHFVDVEYTRAVKKKGNLVALNMLNEVFEISDAYWRAIGKIKKSGYSLNKKYSYYDAFKKFKIEYKEVQEPKGCLCGKILLGLNKPIDCPHFGKTCTPVNAIGPCMVSSEGACAAWYKYGVKK